MKTYLFVAITLLSYSCNWASDLAVVNNQTTIYGIVTPVNPTPKELKAAKVLSHYIALSTGAALGIYTENTIGEKPGIYLGKTKKSKQFNLPVIQGEGYIHVSNNKDVVIAGGSGQGLLYGTYAFIEKFLDGRKYADEQAKVKEQKNLDIPSNYRFEFTPHFVYRQAYYPMSNDQEYLEWHGLHKFEDLWGIWGHSYFKLVDPRMYYKSNPEYFAYEQGKRKTTQICPSSEGALQVAIEVLRKKIALNPDAVYWSISAEDEASYCQCDKCAEAIKEEGGPTGPHIRFVNKIAQTFPNQTFTTLAYSFTQRAPFKTKPAPNVYVMLSTIDAYRNKPLETEPSAAGFRNSLLAWERICKNLLAWDYTTQFTNYLAPLPDIQQLAANIRYLGQHHVKGIFSQGSGDTYGEFAELKSYLIAKLLWNPAQDEKVVLADFYKGYYKAAGEYIEQYANLLAQEAQKTERKIDIYGNPVNEYNSYLSPALLDQYSTLLDQAEGAVEENEKLLDKVYRVRISLDYVVLQQARFYGRDKHGLFDSEDKQTFTIHPKWQTRVDKFVKACKNLGVTELSEGGLSPDAYAEEWRKIMEKGWRKNLAFGIPVKLAKAYAPEYPAKKEYTLTDEVNGYSDYSYNWLCFYDQPMEAELNMNTSKQVNKITLGFLDAPRNWIFNPKQVEVWVTTDGVNYTALPQSSKPNEKLLWSEEHYQVSTNYYTFTLNNLVIKGLKIKAHNYAGLPIWRFKPNRKSMIACDEIWIE